jgi:hypothetical protein
MRKTGSITNSNSMNIINRPREPKNKTLKTNTPLHNIIKLEVASLNKTRSVRSNEREDRLELNKVSRRK